MTMNIGYVVIHSSPEIDCDHINTPSLQKPRFIATLHKAVGSNMLYKGFALYTYASYCIAIVLLLYKALGIFNHFR